MIWFVQAWVRTYFRASAILRELGLGWHATIRFAIKASNLSVCFAGFSNQASPGLTDKCARLGIMSALYDVVSDYSEFNERIWSEVRGLQDRMLVKSASFLLDELLGAKKEGALGAHGLDRGIYAVRIIFAELGIEPNRFREEDIFEIGRFCQVVDDIVDYDTDLQSDHLNYLKESASKEITDAFVMKDFGAFFEDKPRSLVLRFAFARAKRIALRRSFVSEGVLSRLPTPPTPAMRNFPI